MEKTQASARGCYEKIQEYIENKTCPDCNGKVVEFVVSGSSEGSFASLKCLICSRKVRCGNQYNVTVTLLELWHRTARAFYNDENILLKD